MTKKQFIGKIEHIREMVDHIKRAADSVGFDHKALFQMELVAEETIVNIINHGYKGKEGPIEIECYPSPYLGLKVVIKDFGIPYNPLDYKAFENNADRDEQKLGGYGVFFIRSLMDEVKYLRKGNSNILTLVKKI